MVGRGCGEGEGRCEMGEAREGVMGGGEDKGRREGGRRTREDEEGEADHSVLSRMWLAQIGTNVDWITVPNPSA